MTTSIKIIATGSKGNAVLIGGSILIECGVPFSKLSGVYKGLKLVLLTHIHTDHFRKQTVRRLAEERPMLRFGCCEWMAKPLIECGVSVKNIDVYQAGCNYDYRVFKVSPFLLYHDVPNCGYRLFTGGEKMMYATDTRTMRGISAPNYDLYLIEGNYKRAEIDRKIAVKNARGTFSYEERAKREHLSEEQAIEWLAGNMGDMSEFVFLHRHEEC